MRAWAASPSRRSHHGRVGRYLAARGHSFRDRDQRSQFNGRACIWKKAGYAAGSKFDVFVGDLRICQSALTGSLRGYGSFFVRERPCTHHEVVSDPLDGAAVVVAHEIEHVLSLPHHYTLIPCNVMDYDDFGFALTRKGLD